MNIREKLENITDIHGNLIPLIETSKVVYDIILKEGVMTGSTVFGVETENSDVDMIIPHNSQLSWSEVIQNHNGLYLNGVDQDYHYRGEGYKSLYVLWDNKIYNLLFMETEKDYNKWLYATFKIFPLISKDSFLKEKIKDKEFRVEWFEHLKGEYNGSF